MPTYRSTIAQAFVLSGRDEFGRVRVAEAVKQSDDRTWQMTLRHPSGQSWQARYSGDVGVLDALAELLNSKNNDYVADRDRGDRPRDVMSADRNRAVREDGTFSAPTITPRWDR
jgi:hypothetical protein